MSRQYKGLVGLIILLVLLAGGYFGYQEVIKPKREAAQLAKDRAELLPLYNGKLTNDLSIDENIARLNNQPWSTYSNTIYGFNFQNPTNWKSTKKEVTYDPLNQEKGLDEEIAYMTRDDIFFAGFHDAKESDFQFCMTSQGVEADSDRCNRMYDILTPEEKDTINFPEDFSANIFLIVSQNKSGQSLDNWLVDHFRVAETEMMDYSPGHPITLGGVSGLFSDISCCTSPNERYVVKKGDYIFTFGTTYGFDENEKYLKLFADKFTFDL